MKFIIIIAFVVLNSLVVDGRARQIKGDKTITRVVKLLQGLLDKSKADGVTERELYAKHKCYCDSSKAEKTQEVSDLTTEIELLRNKIDGLQSSNGVLSEDTAQKSAGIAANEETQRTAEGLRTKEKEAFDNEEADLTGALEQIKQAIEMLAATGSDQTAETAADHAGFMAGYKTSSLTQLRSTINTALLAAKVFLSPPQQKKVEAFMQVSGPTLNSFYAAQSGEVIGILRQMRDTFAANLESARATEQKAAEAYKTFMATKEEEHKLLSGQYKKLQTLLGANDVELSMKKGQLVTSTSLKGETEEFLVELQRICSTKAAEYESRTLLRANEEAALAQAIAILNSDAAFASFGKVAATSTGSTSAGFLQLRAIRRHRVTSIEELSHVLLTRCKQGKCPLELRRVVALLKAGNPFETVLVEIDKMKATIAKEAVVDENQLRWCKVERGVSNENLGLKNMEMAELKAAIESLTQDIDDPATGLKKNIEDTETSFQRNTERQKEVTDERRADNMAYKQNIANIVEAESLLTEAISVLQKYYKGLLASAGTTLLQQAREAPSTWDGTYTGQSAESQGAISMLEFILGETKKEETEAHNGEALSQRNYEDSMAELKSEQAELEKALVQYKHSLAETELELEGKRKSLDVTTREKMSIELYLAQIKPGCDFITENYDLRVTNRQQELDGLANAVTLLKETPVFKAAVAAEAQEAFGDCKSKCVDNVEHVICKACLAKVTVPGYCAGHRGTEGCGSGATVKVITTLTEPVKAGQKTLNIAVDTRGMAIGDYVTLDRGTPNEETRRITSFGNAFLQQPHLVKGARVPNPSSQFALQHSQDLTFGSIVLDDALLNNHDVGTIIEVLTSTMQALQGVNQDIAKAAMEKSVAEDAAQAAKTDAEKAAALSAMEAAQRQYDEKMKEAENLQTELERLAAEAVAKAAQIEAERKAAIEDAQLRYAENIKNATMLQEHLQTLAQEAAMQAAMTVAERKALEDAMLVAHMRYDQAMREASDAKVKLDSLAAEAAALAATMEANRNACMEAVARSQAAVEKATMDFNAAKDAVSEAMAATEAAQTDEERMAAYSNLDSARAKYREAQMMLMQEQLDLSTRVEYCAAQAQKAAADMDAVRVAMAQAQADYHDRMLEGADARNTLAQLAAKAAAQAAQTDANRAALMAAIKDAEMSYDQAMQQAATAQADLERLYAEAAQASGGI